MKTALVYDRVNKWGGAERVLLALHEIFPNAPLYTAVYSPKTAPWAEVFPKVIPAFLQKVPGATTRHELFPYFMPIAFESFSFDEFDLVISVTSEVAKGIITKPKTFHICYCLTPTRYLWSAYNLYFPTNFSRFISTPVVSYLRIWDKIAAQRPDMFVAISKTVKERIKRYYGRDAKVVYPPVGLTGDARGEPARAPATPSLPRGRTSERGEARQDPSADFPEGRGGYFLIVSRLVPYKRIDIAVEAFNRLNKPLVIVGTGSDEGRLRRMAKGNIKFVGELTDDELSIYYENAQALIFPQEEDFGIAAVEAQNFGCPVIAYRAGGATETLIEEKTGEFFYPQDPEALIGAIKRFNPNKYKKEDLVKNAKKFSKEGFIEKWKQILKDIS